MRRWFCKDWVEHIPAEGRAGVKEQKGQCGRSGSNQRVGDDVQDTVKSQTRIVLWALVKFRFYSK